MNNRIGSLPAFATGRGTGVFTGVPGGAFHGSSSHTTAPRFYRYTLIYSRSEPERRETERRAIPSYRR
jgi:hypothetical protein